MLEIWYSAKYYRYRACNDAVARKSKYSIGVGITAKNHFLLALVSKYHVANVNAKETNTSPA